jgi:hypothetical protein
MEKTGVDIVEGAFRTLKNGVFSEPHLRYKGSNKTYLKRILCYNLENHCVWGKLYRSCVIERLPDMFIEGIDSNEDYCATSRLLALASRTRTDDVVYFYRIDGESTFNKAPNDKKMLSTIKAYNKVLRFYQQRKEVSLALEIGMLQAYRRVRDTNMTAKEMESQFEYVPQRLITRIMPPLLRSDRWYKLGDFLYRAVRAVACR